MITEEAPGLMDYTYPLLPSPSLGEGNAACSSSTDCKLSFFQPPPGKRGWEDGGTETAVMHHQEARPHFPSS